MRFSLFFLLFLGNVYLLLGQTTPAAGDILFTHADADKEVFEFITLKRLNLNSLKFTDNGICSNGSFRLNELIDSFPSVGFNDIPTGTLVRIYLDSVNSDELNSNDGIITLFVGNNGNNLNANGEQLILFKGPIFGLMNCTGTGTSDFITGIDWGNTSSGWINTGIVSSSTSKAPGTATDFAETTITASNDDAIWFSGAVSGNVSTIISDTGSGVRRSSNWSGTGSGTGTFLPLKNIQFHTSNYNSGTAIASSGGGTSSTLNLSGLSFSSTNLDTRYLVVMNANASPSVPAIRYTCYTPSLNFSSAPTVIASVTTPPCSGTSNGNGKVVYFNYTLPSSLVITGLTNNNCYNVQVYAINGNGYSANYSSTPANFNFFTGTLVSSLIAY